MVELLVKLSDKEHKRTQNVLKDRQDSFHAAPIDENRTYKSLKYITQDLWRFKNLDITLIEGKVLLEAVKDVFVHFFLSKQLCLQFLGFPVNFDIVARSRLLDHNIVWLLEKNEFVKAHQAD